MMKTIKHQRYYATNTKEKQLFIDEIFAEKVIPADDSVRLLDQVLEELNYSSLMRAYERTGRNPATNPITLFKILVYGNMDRLYSSRDLSTACKRDINYIWLLNGQKAPNHSEIARFRSKRLSKCCEGLFYQLVKKLNEVGEIQFKHLFVDGTKIEANANKYSFVWQKSTNKYEARNNTKIEKYLTELNNKYDTEFEQIPDMLAYLMQYNTTPFVQGKGKRKSAQQKEIEELTLLSGKQTKYQNYQETFAGRNSFSKTDSDATFMHLKEDHMRNAQLKPAYNVQLGVEAEYIVGLDISSERSDQLTLIPLLEKIEENTGKRHKKVIADAGYEGEENYTYGEQVGMEFFIKPQNYERSKTKKFKSNMNLRENMAYDSEKDEYTCQNGKKLKAVYTGARKSKSGFESEVTYYECESCVGCVHKKTCTRAKGNRKMSLSKKFLKQRKQSLEKITSDEGILLRTNRSIQVEGAFGVIKQDYGFRQFLLRGKKKVYTEMLLMAFGYNINKYHNKIQQNRTGKQLHEKLTV